MNKNLILVKIISLVFLIYFNLNALDWHYDTSSRIEALGINFAGVLKDLQTDIEVRNPAYLEGYRAFTYFHKGHHYYWGMPLNFALFYNHFGLALRYGGHYFLNTDAAYPRNHFYRFNLSGFWSKSNFGLQYDFFIDDQSLDYATEYTARRNENFTFNSVTFGYRPANVNGLDFRFRLGLGYYDSTYSEFIGGQLSPTAQVNFFIPSGQIGFSYEREVLNDASLNLLVDLGGPGSGFELRRLPMPFQSTVRRDAQGKPSTFDFLANSFSTRIAGAISFQPNSSLLIAFGLNDFWSGAKSNQESSNTTWVNLFSLPLAIEYRLNENIVLRGGVSAESYYQYSKQLLSQITSYWYRTQSFGAGFRLFQSWYLDLSSVTNLLQIESVNLALRKEF